MPARSQGRTVATIGVFDGVHVGHQALVRAAAHRARERGLPLTAVTFDPDPMSVIVGPDTVPYLLPVDRRVACLRDAGADRVEVLAFREELQLTAADDFIDRHLVGELGVAEIVIGPDFVFGHRASGNVQTLTQAGISRGFDVTVVDMVGDGTDRWSATRIRSLIADGHVGEAAVGLTRWHALYGEVVHGDHRGRELGYPTANLALAGYPAVPADGVYAGFFHIEGDSDAPWPAAISVGTNPQFDGTQRRVESFVIDEAGLDLYGHSVRVDFVERLRGQEVFTSLDGLVAQMGVDVDRARQVCAEAAAPGGSSV